MRSVNSKDTVRPAGVLSFRAPINEDFEALAEIRRDVDMQELLMTIPDATDDAAVRGWIERRTQDADGAFRIVAETQTNAALGYVQVSQVHRRNRNGYGGIAISRRARLPGLGQAAMRYLVRMAEDELGLTKLLAEIRIDNFPAIQLNMAAGYRIVGTLEKHFHGLDQTYDALLLERCFTRS